MRINWSALLLTLPALTVYGAKPQPPAEGTPPSPTPAPAQCQVTTAVYVTDVERYQIIRMRTDGSNPQVLVSGVDASALDIDVEARDMYWPNHDRDIMRAHLDGSGVEIVHAGMPSPYGLALDVAAKRILWTNQLGDPQVQSSSLAGTDVRNLVPGKAECCLIGIAVDATHNALYWMDGYYRGHVMRAYIDGGNPKAIATTVGIANGVAVDPVGGKVYWTEYGNGPEDDVIRRANLDGSGMETLFGARHGLATPQHIAVDPVAGKIYWTDLHARAVQRSNVDGTGLETIQSGMGYPRGIALLRYPSCAAAEAHARDDQAIAPTVWAPPPGNETAAGSAASAESAGSGQSTGERVAVVSFGKPRVKGAGANGASALRVEQVQTVLAQYQSRIAACYQRELGRQPSLAGRLIIEATLDAVGSVSTARSLQSTVANTAVQTCIIGQFQRMKLPAHSQGTVQVPIMLSYETCFRQGAHSRCTPHRTQP